jgi:hypothetical protein
MPLGQAVEGAEDLVEDADDALGTGSLGERREVGDVGPARASADPRSIAAGH